MITAQVIPPSAFHTTNERQGMWVAPASHEAHTRRPRTKRPKNTALGPWRSKNGWPVTSTCMRWDWNAPGAFEQPAAALAADQVADVVADDRGGRGERDHDLDRSVSWLASTAAAISAVSPGIGRPEVSPITSRNSSG